jgi:hypothetical protein
MSYWHGETIDERGRKAPRQIHAGPAMCGAFIRPDGKFGGLHLTWLNVATSPGDVTAPAPVKAEILDPDSGEVLNSKKMRGSKTGAYIAIVMHDAPRRLVIGEGIETVLSVWTAMHQAGRRSTTWPSGPPATSAISPAGRTRRSTTRP